LPEFDDTAVQNENEPIVHRPAEALDCFLRTRMDVLVLGDYVVQKH